MKPRLLDLFCGAGGAGMGYSRAGFDVVGVDLAPQPRYPFEFRRLDALTALAHVIYRHDGWEFDAIHASPPCQAFTSARVIHNNDHPNLLTPTREMLRVWGGPWVIENVPGAPMRKDIVVCGSWFPDLRDGDYGITRHRWFEFWQPQNAMAYPCHHAPKVVSVFGHGGHVYHGVNQWRRVMGIDWMTRDELAQAIPPAYTEHIGGYLMAALERRAA